MSISCVNLYLHRRYFFCQNYKSYKLIIIVAVFVLMLTI
jgi:hypothetical protein